MKFTTPQAIAIKARHISRRNYQKAKVAQAKKMLTVIRGN